MMMALPAPVRAGWAVLLALGALGTTAAQDREEQPRGWLRFLPLGDDPPFRQIIDEDGVRRELPAEPGTIPPRDMELVVLEERTDLELRLGRFSKPLLAVAGPVALVEAGRGQPWHRLTMPVAPAALALVWRDPEAKTWDRARHLIIADDPQSFQPGQVRFVNLAPVAVAVNFRNQMIGLGPGKAALRGPGGGAALKSAPVAVAIRDERGGWRPVFNSVVNLTAGERSNVVMFRADGVKPRRPVKVVIINERPAFPKLPKS